LNHVAQAPPSDPWFRTRSPDEAIHLCATAFYPHRLSVLGPSNSFGLTLRVTQMGPITLGDITYDTDVALDFNEPRASYHVNVPLEGWLESRHRGQQLTSTPALAAIYRPDAEMAATRWPGGSRHLAVTIDQSAVDRALETLVDGPPDSPIAFDAALPLTAGAARDWVRLLLMVQRQLDYRDSLIRHPLVWDPLAESLIHGLLLVADHPYRQLLAAPAGPGRPAAVRDAMDLIEAGPHLPLTTSVLAKQSMGQRASASPTGRSCPSSPRETRWRPASSSVNAPPTTSKHNTHPEVAGNTYGENSWPNAASTSTVGPRIAATGRRRN
jgi:hypothetical protein